MPRNLHAVTIGLSASGPLEFFYERKSLHNLFGYRRRQSRWWRSTGLWGWWDGTGLHGLVELGSITATEFVSALRRLGDIHLCPLKIENVRTEVYAAAKLVPAAGPTASGRYQSFKIAIEPIAARSPAKPAPFTAMIEPLPIIF